MPQRPAHAILTGEIKTSTAMTPQRLDAVFEGLARAAQALGITRPPVWRHMLAGHIDEVLKALKQIETNSNSTPF